MNDYIYLIIILAAVGFYAYREFMHGPKRYRSRPCMGKAWKNAYPNSENDNIRMFLECLVNGMAFSSKVRLKFEPSDKLMDIYRSIYNGKIPSGDAMECETFLENLASSYSVNLASLYEFSDEETTLGSLYEFVNA